MLKTVIFTTLFSLLLLQAYSQNFTTSSLPIVSITTGGQTILQDTNIMVNMGIIYNGPGEINHINDPFNNFEGQTAIRIRGNTSATFPKKSYALETRDSLGQNLNVSLIDLPEENDWILYGPYSDKSLMRNVLIFELSRRLGMYAPRTKYCELVLNAEYQGIYVLMEKIKRDEERVDISKLTLNDTIGDELTGGYIIKVDGWGSDGWTSNVNDNIYFGYYEPKDDVILEVQKEYIQNFLNDFEFSLDSMDFFDEATLSGKIDLLTFYDYIILNELSKNVDAYRKSVFMHKDKNSNDSLLKMGPLWDYNIGFGNCNYYNMFQLDNFVYKDTALASHIIFWFPKLMEFPAFQDSLRCRWLELRTNVLSKSSIWNVIDSCAQLLSEAQERNFTKWDILGTPVWPNYYVGDTYEEEVEILKSWINGRIDWLDDNLPGYCAQYDSINEILFNGHVLIFPNPFNHTIHVRYQSKIVGDLTFSLYDISGRKVYENHQVSACTWDCELKMDVGMLGLQKGFYTYHLTWSGSVIHVGKLIKL